MGAPTHQLAPPLGALTHQLPLGIHGEGGTGLGPDVQPHTRAARQGHGGALNAHFGLVTGCSCRGAKLQVGRLPDSCWAAARSICGTEDTCPSSRCRGQSFTRPILSPFKGAPCLTSVGGHGDAEPTLAGPPHTICRVILVDCCCSWQLNLRDDIGAANRIIKGPAGGGLKHRAGGQGGWARWQCGTQLQGKSRCGFIAGRAGGQ